MTVKMVQERPGGVVERGHDLHGTPARHSVRAVLTQRPCMIPPVHDWALTGTEARVEIILQVDTVGPCYIDVLEDPVDGCRRRVGTCLVQGTPRKGLQRGAGGRCRDTGKRGPELGTTCCSKAASWYLPPVVHGIDRGEGLCWLQQRAVLRARPEQESSVCAAWAVANSNRTRAERCDGGVELQVSTPGTVR